MSALWLAKLKHPFHGPPVPWFIMGNATTRLKSHETSVRRRITTILFIYTNINIKAKINTSHSNFIPTILNSGSQSCSHHSLYLLTCYETRIITTYTRKLPLAIHNIIMLCYHTSKQLLNQKQYQLLLQQQMPPGKYGSPLGGMVPHCWSKNDTNVVPCAHFSSRHHLLCPECDQQSVPPDNKFKVSLILYHTQGHGGQVWD